MRPLLILPLSALLLGLVSVSVFAEREPDVELPAAATTPPTPAVRHASVPAAGVREPRPEAAATRRAIARAYGVWSEAYAAADDRALAAMYTSDARLVSASEQTIEGRGNIVEFLAAQRRLGLREPAFETLEVVAVGDIAYEIGTFALLYEGAADADTDGVAATTAREERGRYFSVWRVQPDGGWLYHLGVWSATGASEDTADTAMLR